MIEILLGIEHSYFRAPLEVWIKWEFPFLPRKGETISPWIWIEQNTFEDDSLKELLTSEGLDSLEGWNDEITDWLYETGIECNKVFSVAYFKNQKDNGLYVSLFLREE